MPLRHLHNFCVVSRDVLIIQDNIGITLSSDQHLTRVHLKDILLSVWSDPI